MTTVSPTVTGAHAWISLLYHSTPWLLTQRRDGGDPVSAEDYGWPGRAMQQAVDAAQRVVEAAVQAATPTQADYALCPGPWPHTPRRAMDPDAAAALDAIGLGCTAEPRRAR